MRYRKEIILVVDDEPAVLRLTELMLQTSGYEVYTAEDASAAMALAEQLHCGLNLLLTDMQMPGANGHELIRRIRNVCPHIDVIGFSGCMPDADQPRNYPVLAKPFTQEQLLALVRGVLDVQV